MAPLVAHGRIIVTSCALAMIAGCGRDHACRTPTGMEIQQVDSDGMALSDILDPIRRRWYVLLLGLMLAGGLVWATWALAPAQYAARGLVMLLPSQETTGPKGNPLLNLGGLELPARVLVAYYASEPAQTDLARLAPKAEVQVSIEESTRGPIIAVDVTDVTPEGALFMLRHVADSIPENLARIQSEVGAAKASTVRSMPLVLDDEAIRDLNSTLRLMVAAGVAMLAITVFVAVSLDGILLRRAANVARDETPGVLEPGAGDYSRVHREAYDRRLDGPTAVDEVGALDDVAPASQPSADTAHVAPDATGGDALARSSPRATGSTVRRVKRARTTPSTDNGGNKRVANNVRGKQSMGMGGDDGGSSHPDVNDRVKSRPAIDGA